MIEKYSKKVIETYLPCDLEDSGVPNSSASSGELDHP